MMANAARLRPWVAASVALSLLGCPFAGKQSPLRPEVPAQVAPRPEEVQPGGIQPPPRDVMPAQTEADRDRDRSTRPNPPLGPASTAVPDADPQALRDATSLRALTSSTATEDSSLIIGFAVLRPTDAGDRKGAAGQVQGSATLDDESGGTRLFIDVTGAPPGTYEIDLGGSALACEEIGASLGSSRALGTVTVELRRTMRFSLLIPPGEGSLHGLRRRALVIRPLGADGRAGAMVACGEIAISQTTSAPRRR